ncbi:hypothetical protein HZP91_15430 [Elizabethkingia anophelis]|nr:hypothetical protein [Elizabethkingia anophelis]
MNITLRKCVTCKEEKPATTDYFYKDKNRPLGLMYRCKVCDKKRPDNRIYSERVKKMSEIQKLRKEENRKAYSKTIKGRAIHKINSYLKYDNKKRFKCDLTQDYIINILNNEKCIYCGYPSTGVDRIDNNIGHEMYNCVPCCKECNIARGDNFTHDEMFVIGKTIKLIKDRRTSFDPPHFELK